jgi:hypothetical protein
MYACVILLLLGTVLLELIGEVLRRLFEKILEPACHRYLTRLHLSRVQVVEQSEGR